MNRRRTRFSAIGVIIIGLLASVVVGASPAWAVGSPAVAGGVVYETSSTSAGDSHLTSVNATTGAELWSSYVSTAIGGSSPAVGQGLVFAGIYQLYAWPLNCHQPGCPTAWVAG